MVYNFGLSWEINQDLQTLSLVCWAQLYEWKQNLVLVYAAYKMFEQENTDGRQALDWGEKGSLEEMREVRYRIQHQVQYLIVYLKRIQNTVEVLITHNAGAAPRLMHY